MVKQIYSIGNTISDLPLKLARKSFRTLGYAAFEDEVLNQNQIQSVNLKCLFLFLSFLNVIF